MRVYPARNSFTIDALKTWTSLMAVPRTGFVGALVKLIGRGLVVVLPLSVNEKRTERLSFWVAFQSTLTSN